jgi:uncharacterized protein (DUF3820 family)
MMSGDVLQPCSGASGRTDDLLELAAMRMPFGKYKGRLLIDLPEPYVVWFANQGFPEGKLGSMLRTIYEIKVNGLEYLFTPLRQGGMAD